MMIRSLNIVLFVFLCVFVAKTIHKVATDKNAIKKLTKMVREQKCEYLDNLIKTESRVNTNHPDNDLLYQLESLAHPFHNIDQLEGMVNLSDGLIPVDVDQKDGSNSSKHTLLTEITAYQTMMTLSYRYVGHGNCGLQRFQILESIIDHHKELKPYLRADLVKIPSDYYTEASTGFEEYTFKKVSQNDTALIVVKYDYNNSTGDTLKLDRRKQSIQTVR